VKPKLGDDDYLRHIEEAGAKIGRFIAGKSDEAFLADEITQDAVIRNLEIVGEAVSKLSDELRNANPDIPWLAIGGMRNRLIHGYFSVNMTIVLDTAKVMLPAFLVRVKALRGKTGAE
jgi:uncharacterized protein with HEPN domain